MTSSLQIHPADALSQDDKYRIFYSRVVDMAVVSGLLIPDPGTEIGHFAFSRYYYEGNELDRNLRSAIIEFQERHPEIVRERRAVRNQAYMNAVEDFLDSDNEEKIQELILVGASYAVWPTGASFVLTYPWDPGGGEGEPVRFREDLSEFMKRRVIEILRKAGKLKNPNLFTKG